MTTRISRKNLLSCEEVGCFHCLEIFTPAKILNWVDVDDKGIGQTALCPFCEIDAVIGFHSAIPLSKEYLKRLHEKSF